MSDPSAFMPRTAPAPQRPARSDWLSFLEAQADAAGEFRPLERFGAPPAPVISNGPLAETGEPADTHEAQLAQAFETGREQGRKEGLEQADADAQERRKLGIALRQLESDCTDQLATMLGETVKSLCAASFAPIALDEDLLKRRCERAAAMLEEEQKALTLRLNPEDIARLDKGFRKSWTIAPDPDLPQGELRVEGREGAVLDGPLEWARALAEALETC